MEDIEILENKIKMSRDLFNNIGSYTYLDEAIMQAIENLIERNKELEKHYEHEQEYINGEVFSAKQMHFIDDEYIPKSKIKEKIEEINKEIDKCFISQNDKNFCFYECKENCGLNDTKKVLQELLEEE